MTDTVLVENRTATNGMSIGMLTLNAEKSLNALSLAMIRALNTQLLAWRDDDAIACVVLQGAGERAFCAGGDVVSLFRAISDTRLADCDSFFGEEYALDYLIHTYPKPILVWGSGIVMGGGLGLMAGASHRVVSERTRIAMPEVTIGLYPDVAGSWFLNRMPGRLGLYLGLTGASLNAADALFLGLADIALPAAAREQALLGLSDLNWSDDDTGNRHLLSAYLRGVRGQQTLELPPSPVREHFDVIQSLTDYDDVDGMVAAITSYSGGDPWLRAGMQKLAAGSPTSMHLIVETQRRARHMSLQEVFHMELIVSRQCCRHPDLPEGVRALLVDKDNAPKWRPATLAEIDPVVIAAHFVEP